MITPEVKESLSQISAAFIGGALDVDGDGHGGALVSLREVLLTGSPFSQPATFVAFHITHCYPYADIYPHFVRNDLSRSDGKPLGEGMSIGSFRGKPAVQISRRSNKLDPAIDTAVLKLQKVIRWLRTQP